MVAKVASVQMHQLVAVLTRRPRAVWVVLLVLVVKPMLVASLG
jgi:hypothetical protein